MKRNLETLAVAGLVVAAASISQAQSYTVAGTFNGWNTTSDPMTGGPVTYSYVITNGTGTAGAYHEFKITDGSWANSWPGNNVKTKYDANGGNTIYFTPGTIVDGWYPVANRVGYADPGNLTFEIVGDFNGWSSDPGYQLNPIGSGVYSNSCVITNAGTHGFKFRTPGSWSDIFFGSDFGNGGSDGAFATTTSPETVPVVLDLPNGRWVIGAAAPPPVTNTVVFSVDMTIQVAIAHFDPLVDTVECRGSFNGWSSGALVLTNDPAGANTNLYVGQVTLTNSPLTRYEYKFWNSNARAGNSGWESPASTGGGNRAFNLMAANGTLTLPSVYFNDLTSTTDFLTEDTLVTFTVNMTNAMTTDGVSFTNTVDNVYINGDWIPWWPWNDPLQPYLPYVLTNGTSGDMLYSGTFLIPKGNSLTLTYKFSLNGLDNELAAYVNHVRYIRNVTNYTMPLDKFGTQITEPPLGPVTIGQPSGGNIPVSWVGLPPAYLQTATDILGPWVSHPETAAYGTPSGIYSTNYPMSGQGIFFRAVKP